MAVRILKKKRLTDRYASEIEKYPPLAILVQHAWANGGHNLPSFIRGLSCVDRSMGGNKKLLDELNFLIEIARLRT